MLKDILTEIGQAAVIVAAAAWLIKKIVEIIAARSAQSHKQKLEMQSAIAVEQTRSELQRLAYEHQIRFARLHEKRAEVIAELYDLMVQFIAAAERYFPGRHVEAQKFQTFADKQKAFVTYFERHRIYFSEVQCEAVDRFIGHLRIAANEKFIVQDFEPLTQTEQDEMRDKMLDRWTLITEEVPKIRCQLENDFREMLGVENR